MSISDALHTYHDAHCKREARDLRGQRYKCTLLLLFSDGLLTFFDILPPFLVTAVASVVCMRYKTIQAPRVCQNETICFLGTDYADYTDKL